jgi:hypothetical protein
MRETDDGKPNRWKRPLKGWSRLGAWVLVFVGLATIIRIVLGLKSTDLYRAPSGSPWLAAIGLAVAVAMVIWFLVQGFSSRRNFKRLLFGVACLAGLIALVYAEEDIRAKLVWSLFKSHWEAKGEKFDFAAFIPPTVPDEQNFATAPVVATTYSRILDRNGHRLSLQDTNVVDRLQMPLDFENDGPANTIGNWQKATPSELEPWQNYYRDLSESTNVFLVARHPQTPAVDVLLALSKYDSTIEELRQAAARPASRFPLDYGTSEKFAILLPHLAPLKGCAVVLRMRALAELQAEQSQQALADIRLALDLTEKIRSEPFLISQLVRIAIFHITVQPIWEGLAQHRWTDSQLSDLDRQLATFDFVADYAAAMRGENVCQVAAVDYMRDRPGQFERVGEFGENHSTQLADLCVYLIPSGWFYQNERRCAKFILEQFLPIGDVGRQTFSPRLVQQANQALQAMRSTPYTWVCKMFLPGLTKAAHRFAFAQGTLNLVRSGCALERYRLATGKYPETLDALAPRFISKVPRDPIGGQPLLYRCTDNQHFVLYSVGWNQTDDDGQVCVLPRSGAVDLDRGDWVWRYPD